MARIDAIIKVRRAVIGALGAKIVAPKSDQAYQSIDCERQTALTIGKGLAETGLATLEWWRAQTPERRAAAAKFWPTPEQEKAVLEHMSRT
jgi:hypothetical protein